MIPLAGILHVPASISLRTNAEESKPSRVPESPVDANEMRGEGRRVETVEGVGAFHRGTDRFGITPFRLCATRLPAERSRVAVARTEFSPSTLTAFRTERANAGAAAVTAAVAVATSITDKCRRTSATSRGGLSP
jgi:hypothetical protein